MGNFKDYNQEQGIFRTIVPAELLEEDHPARIVDIVVENLDLEKLYEEYSEEGCPGYHPKMLLKVLFYSYFTGMMSCRGMWNNLKYRADYIFLSGDQVPDFRTINRFRLRVKTQLPKLFTQIVMLCVELGLVDFNYLAIDGQKIQANANFRKSKNKERYAQAVNRVRKGMEKLLTQELTEDLTEAKKQKAFDALKKQEKKLLEFEQIIADMEETDNINLTDKDAKLMSHKDGKKTPSYNHQSAADGKYGVTVAVSTRKDAFDHGSHLLPMVDKAKENTGRRFKHVMADCAFCDFERLIEIEDRKEDFYLPDRDYKKEYKKNTLFAQNQFKQDDQGRWICPAGRAMQRKGSLTRKDGVVVYLFMGKDCGNCELKKKCTKGKSRQIGIDSRFPYRLKMREKLETDKGRAIYSKRQGIIEPPHGHDQKNLGWRQHHLRGIENAALEFMLIRIGSNLGKIARYGAKKMKEYAPPGNPIQVAC
jgi:transposase